MSTIQLRRMVSSGVKKIKTYFIHPDNRVEVLFVTIATVVGMTMALIIPPSQGADEQNHFLRAYQISQGQFLPQNEGPSVGGQLPNDIVSFARGGLEAVQPGDTSDKLSAQERESLSQIPDDDTLVGVSFSNTAVYSPVAYAPRSIAIWVANLFDASPITLLYVSRIVGLLVAIAIITWAIRLLPFGRLPAAIVALIPMSVSQLAVVSADSMVIALSFLAIAATLHFSFRAKPLKAIDFGGLLLIFTALSLTKPALFPLAIITLALLINKAIPKQFAVGAIIAICVLSTGTTLAWNAGIQEFAVRGFEADVPGVNYNEQLHFIIMQPVEYGVVIARTLFTEHFDPIPQQFIGSFGWLDTRLPYVLVIIAFIIIACSILISSFYEKRVMPWWLRLVGLVGGLGVVMVTFTSQYLFWISVQKPWNDGLQGRYFLPAAPVIALSLLGGKPVLSERYYRRLVYAVFAAMSIVLLVALIFIAVRYYSFFGPVMP